MCPTANAPSRSTRERVCAFYAVGAMGMCVQLATIWLLAGWGGLHYLLGTALAVEVSVMHNFIWHERWTWADRSTPVRATSEPDGGTPVLKRLIRFHLATGLISLWGNVALTALFVAVFGAEYLLANVMAIAACSAFTFLAADRLVFRAVVPALLAIAAFGPAASAAELRPETVAAWDAYVAAAELRIAGEFDPGHDASGDELDVSQSRAPDATDPTDATDATEATGTSIAIPRGLIHHWRGRVFIPGTTTEHLLGRLLDPSPADFDQEDVLESRVLERGRDRLRIFLRLHRTEIVTVVYDTEHVIRFRRHGPGLASSRSVATRIVEVSDAQTADERQKPDGEGRGFLWRMNAYWRYQQVANGVLVECESISLSRSIPGVLRVLIQPLIDGTARDSLERTLLSMRARYAITGDTRGD
jgi:putative flippase GtrA